MMYSNKLAVAVKANGKVLREFGDLVYVPFGSEYTILIKNLNSVRVQVRVHVDGEDATGGHSLVIGANQETELKRFIKNGNLKEGNSFKFIERTGKIEAGPRGIKVDDGLIRIEYEFEKVVPKVEPGWPVYRPGHWEWKPDPYYFCDYPSGGVLRSTLSNGLVGSNNAAVKLANLQNASYDGDLARMAATSAVASLATGNEPVAMYNATACSASATSVASSTFSMASSAVPQTSPTKSVMRGHNPNLKKQRTSVPREEVVNETGITVAGSVNKQSFSTVAGFLTESTTHTMVIRLLGETEGGKVVVQPVTVKAKPKCTTCGHTNKAKAKFCSECGTSLEIV